MRKLAMVTGASSGIGAAYAERLAVDGFDLVVVARRRERLEELAGRLAAAHGASVRVVAADLGDPAQAAALANEAAGLGLELLVNNAALAHYKPFAELPGGEARELVDLNVLAPVLLTRAVVPGMVERGSGAIVNVASLLAFSGAADAPQLPKRAIYAASKAFLVAFSQILATELSGTGVRVQALCPGVVRTEFHTRQGMDISAMPRMEPESVVTASLLDLERGAVVSLPGVSDEAPLGEISAAQGRILVSTTAVELPPRYSS